MPSSGPVSRGSVVEALREAGFDGPYSAGRHRFMVRGELRLRLPAEADPVSPLDEALARIDALKDRLETLEPVPPTLLDALRADWEVSYTYYSNAVEGGSLTLEETRAVLLDGVTIAGRSLREHLEAVNHREAMRLVTRLAVTPTPLLESEVLAIHRALLTGIRSEEAGRFRSTRARTTNLTRVFPNPIKVPELVDGLLAEVNASEAHPALLAARLHHGLLTVHPFAEGNGRTARLLTNLLLLRRGFPPAFIPAEERERYAEAVRSADEGWPEAFGLLIAETVEAALARTLEVIG